MGNFKLVHFVEFPLHEMDKLVPKIKKSKRCPFVRQVYPFKIELIQIVIFKIELF